MSFSSAPDRCRGVITLFVASVMLFLSGLMVAAAVRISATNLAAVGNVQARVGAIAAADTVLAGLISRDYVLAGSTLAHVEEVDLNQDGSSDVRVVVDVPRCLRAVPAEQLLAHSVSLSGFASERQWQTVWELTATATDTVTGASVSVSKGVRYVLSSRERADACG